MSGERKESLSAPYAVETFFRYQNLRSTCGVGERVGEERDDHKSPDRSLLSSVDGPLRFDPARNSKFHLATNR